MLELCKYSGYKLPNRQDHWGVLGESGGGDITLHIPAEGTHFLSEEKNCN